MRKHFLTVLGILTVACLSASAAPPMADWTPWERLYGPSPTSAVIGQGGLTVGVNSLGRMVSCRWPGPGDPDQLTAQSYDTDRPDLGMPLGHGAQWGMLLDGEVRWLTAAHWLPEAQAFLDVEGRILETRCRLRDEKHPDVRLIQRIYFSKDPNVMALECKIYGLDTPPILYWFQNFTPCTKHLPELPLRDWQLDRQNDFAALMDANAGHCFQFRPAFTSNTLVKQAETLIEKKAAMPEWNSLGTGVWIGTASPHSLLRYRCATDAALEESFHQASTGGLDQQPIALGQGHALLELEALWDRGDEGDGYRAGVVIAFGRAWDDTHARLNSTLSQEFPAWQSQEPLAPDTYKEAIRVLRKALDQQHGVVVLAPITQPPLARCTARLGAWSTLALNQLDATETAAGNIGFYLNALRQEDAPGMPAGSLPAWLYADGTPASPHVILDVTASAWLSAGLWRHLEFLEETEQQAFLEAHRDSLFLLGDFLAQWSQVDSGQPRPSYDTTAFRDRARPELSLTLFMGLHAAVRACRLREEPPEEWTRQEQALEALLRFHMLNEGAPWAVEATFPAWLTGMLDADHTLWQGACRIAGEVMTLREAATLELQQDFLRYPDAIAASYFLTRPSE